MAVSMALILSLFVVVRSSAVSLCLSQLRSASLRWMETIAGTFRSICSRSTSSRAPSGADPYQRYLLDQAHARKVVYARMMDWYFLAAVNLALIAVVYQISIGRPRWIDIRGSWVLLAYQLPILCMLHCPQFGKSMSLDFHYLFMLFLLLFLTSPLGSSADHTLSYSFMGFVAVSIPATVVPTRLCSVVLGQAALMVMCTYRAYSEHLGVGLCEDVSGSQRAERTLVSWNLYFLVAASFIFLMADALIKHQVASKIRESDKQVQLSATTSLLELTCDAVVRLDVAMRLEDHSPKLAAMLLRTGTSLKGVAFTDLLGESHHGPEFQLNPDTTAATARAFQTQMVDCCSNKFKVEIFSVKYSLTDGQKCHIVGLRDLEDQESLAMRRVDGADHEWMVGGTATASVLVEGCASLDRRSTTSLGSDSLGLLGQWRLRPPVPCLNDKSKENFLEIDVDSQVVIAATAPYHSLAGRQLPNIFGPDSLSLLWRVLDEERQVAQSMANSPANRELQLPNRLVTFSHMPFFLPERLEISGSIKVAVTSHGDFHVIMCFVESVESGFQTSL